MHIRRHCKRVMLNVIYTWSVYDIRYHLALFFCFFSVSMCHQLFFPLRCSHPFSSMPAKSYQKETRSSLPAFLTQPHFVVTYSSFCTLCNQGSDYSLTLWLDSRFHHISDPQLEYLRRMHYMATVYQYAWFPCSQPTATPGSPQATGSIFSLKKTLLPELPAVFPPDLTITNANVLGIFH